MKKFTYLIIFLFTIQISSAQTPLETAVDFNVKDIHGNTISLFPLLDEGKLVVIDFFSTSCGPCALYAPEIEASYQDFGLNEGNVFFMSICWGDDNAGVAYFDSAYNITHPSVSGSQGGGNIVHNDYLIISTPTVILIAPDREILEQYIWEPTQENLNAAITAAGGTMVGIDDEITAKENPLFIYPNPATDRVNVRVDVIKDASYRLEIINLLGTKVHETIPSLLSSGEHILTTDVAGLPAGTYFIRLLKDEQHEMLGRLLLTD